MTSCCTVFLLGLAAGVTFTLTISPASADGGTGGRSFDGPPGGAGGSGFSGANGDPGTPANPGHYGGGGGGGGGAGLASGGAGGVGGHGSGNAAGGTSGTAGGVGVDGGAGGTGAPGAASSDGGGGGGGGGGGAAGNGSTGTITGNVTGSTGGQGGTGGQGNMAAFAIGGGGGSGGAGGFGAVVTTNGVVNNFAVNGGGGGGGGGGGAGGGVGIGGDGGSGGDGGTGVQLVNGITGFTNIVGIGGGGGGGGGAGGDSAGGIPDANGGNGGAGGSGIAGNNVAISNFGLVAGGNGGGAFAGGVAGNGGFGIVGSGLTILNTGTISGGSGNSGQADALSFTGGVNSLTLSSGGIVGTLTGGIGISGSLSIDSGTAGGTSVTLGSDIHDGTNGAGSLTKIGVGTLVLSGASTYTGATNVNVGTLRGGAANAFSASSVTSINAGATLDLGGFAQTINTVNLAGGTLTNGALAGAISSTGGTISGIDGAATLTTTSGITTVNGVNTFAGPTTVNGGTLLVNGSLTDPTVNAGGVLTGTGSVGDTTVNAGGIFAPGTIGSPGTSMAVNGNLALQSGAAYVVYLNPATSSFSNVTGTATLNGATVNAIYANGSYIAKRYTILTAASVNGTFSSTVVNTNLPSGFHSTLSYDKTDAYLDLALNFAPPPGSGLSGNQQAVANAIVNFFNTNGGIPMVFGGLTPAGLTQLSGESATGTQQTTFDAMSQFMGLMTDPFMARSNDINGSGAPTGYAQDDQASAYAARKKTDAFAMFTKAPPTTFVQRWSVWAAGYGGSQSTSGNALLGSNDTTSRIAGTAVGADYLFSPNTLAGFALAGGGTNFSVNNLGSGRSDLFQAGAYVRHTEGNAYITGALAYGWQDITTDRTVTAAGIDHLRAEFNANAYSGRVEGGYRFVVPTLGGLGITPYAAGQFTTFDLPAYTESIVSGSPAFALNYAAKSVTDSRSELGIRSDKSLAMANGILTLRGRLAWAHDFDPDRSIAATFQALPGASFVVNGAAQASDSVLSTAAAEWKWINGWSAAATFEGEFSKVTQSYAGKGVVRYAW
jgi:uncharacterized protein with beta-barrel porin domain